MAKEVRGCAADKPLHRHIRPRRLGCPVPRSIQALSREAGSALAALLLGRADTPGLPGNEEKFTMVDNTRWLHGDMIINVLIRRYACCARKKVAGTLAGLKFLKKFARSENGKRDRYFQWKSRFLNFYVLLKSR